MTTTKIRLIDADDASLDSNDVVRVARSLPSYDGPKAIVIDERRLDPVSLVAQVLEIESRFVSFHSALGALKRLEFKLTGEDPPPKNADLDILSTEYAVLELSEETMRSAQRLFGEWIAARDGEMVAHAESLGDLLRDIGDREAVVFRIPNANERD